MIIDMVKGNILKGPEQHIAFAVNTHGFNDAGFAGLVAQEWLQLAVTGGNEMGEVLEHNTEDATFHAMVCHSLSPGGWDETPETVTACLDALDVPEDEVIAVVAIGAGPIGQMGGADSYAILGAMARSKKRIKVYTL